MIRANSPLREFLGPAGVDFINHATGALERILPHVGVSKWKEDSWKDATTVWASIKRTEIRLTVAIGNGEAGGRSLSASVERRSVPGVGGSAKRSLDAREYDICKRIVLRISETIKGSPARANSASIQVIRDAFDEYIVAQHVKEHHQLEMSVGSVFDALHTLSEQSYENKSVTFGCLLNPKEEDTGDSASFPVDFLESKKYKALSDGYRTAYHISTKGAVIDFVDLDRFEKKSLTEKHYYPEWAEPIARASRKGRCGISLSRQGDILVFDNGTLRFTYRYGGWQYWNHAHLVNLLRDRARAQRVPQRVVGRVIGSIYRAALDVSFRRSGGLFVILHNRNNLSDVVRRGDTIGDSRRTNTDVEFDAVISKHVNIYSLPRPVAVELASLDGAIVIENSGKILAYGAVLQPKKTGRLEGSEGSRTKAAIGASNYGLAIKISSDGDITVYYQGKEFIRM